MAQEKSEFTSKEPLKPLKPFLDWKQVLYDLPAISDASVTPRYEEERIDLESARGLDDFLSGATWNTEIVARYIRGDKMSKYEQEELNETLTRSGEAFRVAGTKEAAELLVKARVNGMKERGKRALLFAAIIHRCGFFDDWSPRAYEPVRFFMLDPHLNKKFVPRYLSPKAVACEEAFKAHNPYSQLSQVALRGMLAGDQRCADLIREVINIGSDGAKDALLDFISKRSHIWFLPSYAQILREEPSSAENIRRQYLEFTDRLIINALEQSDSPVFSGISKETLSSAAFEFISRRHTILSLAQSYSFEMALQKFGVRGLCALAKALGEHDLPVSGRKRGKDEIQEKLDEARLSYLRNLLKHSSTEVQVATVRALGDILKTGQFSRQSQPKVIDLLVGVINQGGLEAVKIQECHPAAREAVSALSARESRFGTRRLMELLTNQEINTELRWEILKALSDKEMVDSAIPSLLRSSDRLLPQLANRRRFQILNALSGIFGVRLQPTKAIVSEVMSGTPPEIIRQQLEEKLKQLGKTIQTIRPAEVASDELLADLYWVFAQPDIEYSGALSYRKFKDIVEQTQRLSAENDDNAVLNSLRAIWRKRYSPAQATEFERRFIEGAETIPAEIEIAQADKNQIVEQACDAIGQKLGSIIKLMVLADIIEKVEAAVISRYPIPTEPPKTDEDKFRYRQLGTQRKQALTSVRARLEEILKLNLKISKLFEPKDIRPAYLQIARLLQELQSETSANLEEGFKNSTEKATAKLTSSASGLFSSVRHEEGLNVTGYEIRSNVPLENRAVRVNSIVKAMESLREFSHLKTAVDDVLIEVRARKSGMERANQTHPTQVVYVQLAAPWELIKRMRGGDARESCLNTRSGSSRTIAGLTIDLGSMIFVLTDERKRGIGHIHAKIEISDQDEIICSDEGLYLMSGSPGESGTKVITKAVREILSQIGFDYHAIAKNVDYSDIAINKDYNSSEIEVSRLSSLQHTRSYSESGAGPNRSTSVKRRLQKL